MLGKVLSVVKRLRNTSSSIDKQQILLEEFTKNLGLIAYFRSVYDPNIQYYLTNSIACKKGINTLKMTRNLFELLEMFASRKATGQHACNLWRSFVESFEDSEIRGILGCILDKDFKCRMGLKSVNKVLSELKRPIIYEHTVALGESWDGSNVWEHKKYYASRKLDGVRCSVVIGGETLPVLLSRQGKAFETLNNLAEELRRYKGVQVLLDGELALRTPNSCDDFQGLMKVIRRKNYQIPNIVFHVFDAIPLNVDQNMRFGKRIKLVKEIVKTFNSPMLQYVEQIRVMDTEHFQRLLAKANKLGWEGLILRKSAPYISGRSKDILKVKKMKDFETKVLSIETGKINIVKDGKEKTVNAMTACFISYKGNKVKVGSGWTQEQRRSYYKNPNLIIGKTITVQYFSETKNKKGGTSIRFPVVKIVHGLERTV